VPEIRRTVSSGFFVLNANLKGENKMGNLIQYIAQEDPEKENLEFRRKTFFQSASSRSKNILMHNDFEKANGNIPRYWETADDGKKVYDYVVKKEGKVKPKDQNILDYIVSATKGSLNLGKNFFPMRKINFTDKYKHAFMNCNAAQYGKGGADIAKLASDLREWNDVRTGSNTLDSSKGDNYANKVGRLLGSKYPKGDCNALIEKYIKKNW
jgi:rhs family protein